MSKTIYTGSIAMKSFNAYVSYEAIYIAVLLMGFCNINLIIVILLIGVINKSYILFSAISTGTFILLNIPREAITYKFIVCFNYSYYQIAQARASLTLILMVLMSLFHLFLFLSDQNLEKKSYKLLFPVSILFLIGIAILNIFLLVNLNTSFKKDINLKKIKMGFFNKTEIDLIDQNKFEKDSIYPFRLVGSLSDILFSYNKRLAYSHCTRSNCRRYYWRFFYAEINCGSTSKLLYPDCLTAEKLIIKLNYLDSGPYPSYNCAVVTKNQTCFSSCPGLGERKLHLVQEFDNKIELGWSGFSNCEVKKPKIVLDEEIGWNICPKNFSQKIKTSFWSFVFFFLIIVFNEQIYSKTL